MLSQVGPPQYDGLNLERLFGLEKRLLLRQEHGKPPWGAGHQRLTPMFYPQEADLASGPRRNLLSINKFHGAACELRPYPFIEAPIPPAAIQPAGVHGVTDTAVLPAKVRRRIGADADGPV